MISYDNADFESKHPRNDDGEFTASGGGSGGATVRIENKTLTGAEKMRVKDFLLGKPVAELKSGVIKIKDSSKVAQEAIAWAENNICGTVESSDIGEVVISRSGIRNSLYHGMGAKKIDAIPAIPTVIKKGETISIRTATKDYPKTEILKAAPINIDGKTTIMIARMRKADGDNNTRFYVHEVWTLEEAKQGKLNRSGTPDHNSNQTNGEFPSFLSILQNIFDVKDNITKDAKNPMETIETELYFGDIERRVWGRFRAKEKAAYAVMPLLGEISPFAYDSAEDIYREALKRAGWDTSQYPKEAYRGMTEALLKVRGLL